jgi:integrase
VERDLVAWGRLLHDAAMPFANVANVKEAWATIDSHADRRFSVHVDVDAALEAGAVADEVKAAKEAATLLARHGVSPGVAQKLMRHSDIRLTMNTYTHLDLADTAGAVATLPCI